MSCRDTSGGSASLSLARARTGLPETQLKGLFHSLKREGAGLPEPTEKELAAWRQRQEWLLKKVHVPERQRESIRQRLFRSNGEPIPDGATFYAWSRLEARALQEQAIAASKEAVDLSPPGSQAELYEYDEEGRIARVYYASYGSNLFRDRFMAYVEGGKVEGATRDYWGCRDTTPPEDDIPIRFAARPMFAMESLSWGGGVAFMDADGEGTGLGRAYLISGEQFDDVVAQENGYRPGMIDAPLTEAVWNGSADVGDVLYGRLVHIGDHDGAPVVTFTGAFSTEDALLGATKVKTRIRELETRVNRPSPAYVRMIGAGLRETFGLTEIQQADYIRGCPGGDQWSRKDLLTALRGIKLPEEIEAEKKAAEAEKRRKKAAAAAAARKADEASKSYGGWSFGSGSGYRPVAGGAQYPLWSDEPGRSSDRRTGGSIFQKCDGCGQMNWCMNRWCDSCRRKGRNSATQNPQPAGKPKSKQRSKAKGKPSGSAGAGRRERGVVFSVPHTTVDGWDVVKVGDGYAVASPSGTVYSEKDLSDALIRLVDRQDDIYRRIRFQEDGAQAELADNQDAVQNYTEALAALQSVTRPQTARTSGKQGTSSKQGRAAAPVTKPDGTKVTPMDMPQKRPSSKPSSLYYPSSVPDSLTVYVQPHLDEPVVRLPQSDIEFTSSEALEWLHEQKHLPADIADDSGVNRLVDALTQMERLRTPKGKKPRTLVYDAKSFKYTWR